MGIEIYYKFILTFAVILLAARVGGELAERYLKQPAVIGELLAGIIISPFALGNLIHDPIILHFAVLKNVYGVEEFSPLEVISEISVITLLFFAGVETNIRAFIKQSVSGILVAIGGVLLPFILGYFITAWLMPQADSATRLFVGAILTATSIGLTARILMSAGMLNKKVGILIIVAAVVDDIIGIIVLSLVLSLSNTGQIDVLKILQVVFMGFGTWFLLLFIGLKFNRQISHYFLRPFRKSGTVPIVALILGFIISYAVTLVQLHPVVGAYAAGLLFSATPDKEEIQEKTRPIMLFIAPFFFTYMGMQVNLFELSSGGLYAVVIVLTAILGKIIGCAIPARLAGKVGWKDSFIVGAGMVPRGEVGLIIAGVGLIIGVLDRTFFSVAVAVGIITTLVTPLILKPLLKKPV